MPRVQFRCLACALCAIIVYGLSGCGLISGRGGQLAADPFLGQSITLENRNYTLREFIAALETQCRLDVALTTNLSDEELDRYPINALKANETYEYRAPLPLKAYQALDYLRMQHDKIDGPRVSWHQEYKRRVSITFLEVVDADVTPN